LVFLQLTIYSSLVCSKCCPDPDQHVRVAPIPINTYTSQSDVALNVWQHLIVIRSHWNLFSAREPLCLPHLIFCHNLPNPNAIGVQVGDVVARQVTALISGETDTLKQRLLGKVESDLLALEKQQAGAVNLFHHHFFLAWVVERSVARDVFLRRLLRLH
jgi:hypothetical protein